MLTSDAFKKQVLFSGRQMCQLVSWSQSYFAFVNKLHACRHKKSQGDIVFYGISADTRFFSDGIITSEIRQIFGEFLDSAFLGRPAFLLSASIRILYA